MITDENDPDVCRICANLSNQTENLFETLHNEMVLSDMLKFCLKRSILKEDLLPRHICFNCKSKLIATYDFLNICETSEKYLLTKYSLQETDDDLAFPQCNTLDENQSNDVNTILIKCEDDDDDDVFGYKDDSAPASEIICVDEQFVESNVIDARIPEFDENSDSETRSQSPETTYQLRTKQPIEQRIYECYECRKQFQQVQQLRSHMHDHDRSRKPFECVTCNLRFMHLNSWFRHRSRHTKNIHNCEYCAAEFNTLTALKRHIQEVHKERMNSYRCEQCSEEFSLKFLLIWHYEWHKKAKQFVCNTCEAVFFSERKLKAHIRDNHASMLSVFIISNFTNSWINVFYEGHREFQSLRSCHCFIPGHLCAECGKSFKTIHLLTSHQMLHRSEKPFACNLCPSRFKWKTALTTHMLVHTGQKQHVCDICGSSFTTKGSMKKHKSKTEISC